MMMPMVSGPNFQISNTLVAPAQRYGEGETLDEAIESANEAARDWITLELSEDEPMIPYVSDIEDIEVKDGEIIRNISMNIRFYEGWDE